MQSVRVNEQGQIDLPPLMMEKLGIEKGMEFFVIKRNGEYVFKPTPLQSLEEIQKICSGKAEEAGWKSEEDVNEFMSELRKERYIQNANND